MKLAIVGATGIVGREILKVMEERNFLPEELILAASEKSVGTSLKFHGKEITLISLQDAVDANPDVAIFSAGAEISKQWAPIFAEKSCFVVDNSSAWRMNKNTPLVVPEINAGTISDQQKIIANPNCSTIQLVMALFPLHNKYTIKRLVISTYQSVSGSGARGVQQLMDEREGKSGNKIYPHQIDLNVLPQAGDFVEDGYTSEEIKLVEETKKILDTNIAVTATAVRVAVVGGHSEAVNIEFENDFEIFEVRRLLGNMPGVVLMDIPEGGFYPMPIVSKGRNEVFVGRIRRDFSQANSLNLWVVADNLRKGAATNAVQIAEYLTKNILTD